MIARVVVFVLAFVGGAWLALAHAQVATTTGAAAISYGTNGGTVVGSALTGPVGSGMSDFERLISKPLSGPLTGANVVDKVPVTVGGKSVVMDLARNIPLGAIARGAAAIAGPLAVGMAVKDLYDHYRAKKDANDNPVIDDGTGKVAQQVWRNSENAQTSTSLDDACQSWTAAVNQGYAGTGYVVTFLGSTQTSANGGVCRANKHQNGAPNGDSDQLLTGVASASTEMICPAQFDGLSLLVPAGSPVGYDGKCPTGRYSGTTKGRLEDLFANGTKLPDIADRVASETMKRGTDYTPDAQPASGSLTGPAQSTGTPTVTTTTGPATPGNPSGQTVTTSTPVQNISYTNNTFSTTTTTVTVAGDTITTTNAPTDPQKVEVCGLPGKPACKIDETGTPEQVAPEPKQEKKSVDDGAKGLRDIITTPQSVLPTFPDLAWSFELPTGCGPISIPAFAPYLSELNVCQFQPEIHDLMSVIWVMGGVFGAIGLFFRDQLSSL